VLIKFFSAPQNPLSFADTVVLFMGLIAINPPINSVSIAFFLKKWEELDLIPAAKQARETFLGAVQQIAAWGSEGGI
jgi:hypothetical protein